MATDWDEVKRLAADFQRAQLSSTVQRLSERNCVEIVKKLIELKLIEVIFTTDGKEYLTPQRLLKEIKDELTFNGGRMNLVELSQVLGVDLSHIEAKASEYIRGDPNVQIILGQLITNDYLDYLAEEINEKLQQAGQITIGELTKQYDLPGDFLEEVVNERIGTIIHGMPDTQDSRTFFTLSFVAQHRARIQGILSAVTRPILMSHLISTYQIPERLFHSISEELVKSKRLAGSISSPRSDKAMYVPEIYARAQNQWVDSFYKQNGYLEYDALARLGIQDSKSFAHKRFKEEQLTFLSSCCVGKSILTLVESSIEEALNTGTVVDIMSILPSIFTASDCQQIIKNVIKTIAKQRGVIRVYCDSIVVSDDVIQNCMNSFEPIMNTRATEDIEKRPNLFLPQSSAKGGSSKKEDHRSKQDKDDHKKKKVGKSGGGTQGRETKNRSVKKKYLAHKDENSSDEESYQSISKDQKELGLTFLSVEAIADHLRENMSVLLECPQELILQVAEEIYRPLNKKYIEVATALYNSTVASTGSERRKQYADFQEKLNSLLAHITLFEKSIKSFPEDTSTQLNKHLLKTLCNDVVNMILDMQIEEHGIHFSEPSAGLSFENRQKMIDKLPEDLKQPLKKMHTSTNSKTLEDFWSSINDASTAGLCEISTKKADKKKERLILANHRQSLLSQLSEADEPALCLHLAVLVIFQTQTHNILHASGKFVPQIIGYLQKHVPLELYKEIAGYQDYVTKRLTVKDEDTQEDTIPLEDMLRKIKETAITYKKVSISET